MWLSSRTFVVCLILVACSSQPRGAGPEAAGGARTSSAARGAARDDRGGPCVDLLADCTPASAVLETVCGLGEHELAPATKVNASTIVLRGVSKVSIHHCSDGGPLAGQKLDLDSTTSLCALPGGCCEEGGKRWNDQICFVTLY